MQILLGNSSLIPSRETARGLCGSFARASGRVEDFLHMFMPMNVDLTWFSSAETTQSRRRNSPV